MQNEIMNFEEINAHIEQHTSNLSVNTSTLTPNSAQAQLCSIYKAVRPILVALSKLILIPNKWKKAIASLISILDVLCP